MANFLTNGRTAFVAALKADPAIDPLVKKWFEFAAGLTERFDVTPAMCPFIAIYPSEGNVDERFNRANEINHDLDVIVGTDTQDVAQIEELGALILDRIIACRNDALGLSDAGLKTVQALSLSWLPWKDEKAARIIWQLIIRVRLQWIRNT